jgi:hypothetical protein
MADQDPQQKASKAPPKTGSDVAIVVTVNHVYLPLDENGNGRRDWQAAGETTRIDKRARLKVPSDLAKFLSDRDQAEIL